MDTLGFQEDAIHGSRHSFPSRFFYTKLLLAGGGQFVDAGAPAVLVVDPFGANPAGLFHAVESWIEGTLLHSEDVGRNLLNSGHDRVALQARTAGERILSTSKSSEPCSASVFRDIPRPPRI